MVKKVLITGIAGFIGYHTAIRFKELGWDVSGFDNFNNIVYDPQIIKANIHNFKAIDGLFFKPYACCRWIHSAIDALLTLMHAHQIKAKDIK